MKAMLWGCYSQGNFGDDLMALLFTRLLERKGLEVKVYSRNQNLFEQHGVASSDALPYLAKWADIVFVGGGAFFKKKEDSSSLINHDIKQLFLQLKDTRKPFFLLSVGSDGVSSKEELFEYRRYIIDLPGFEGGIVRLKRDLQLEPRKFSFGNDFLLSAPIGIRELFPSFDLSGRLVDKVALNTSWKTMPRFWSSFHGSVFFRSHDPCMGIKSEAWIPGIERYDNRDPIVSALDLSSCSSVSSSKLHVGLTACAFGVPFRSICGNDKTRQFLLENSTILSEDGVGGVFLESKEVCRLIYDSYLGALARFCGRRFISVG